MAIRNLVSRQVNNAFRLLGDLTVDVTLSQKDASGYNFATGEVTETSGGTTTIKGVLLEETKESTDGSRTGGKLLIKTADIGNIDVYDSFTINDKTYKLESYEDNSFVIEIEVKGA